MGAFGYNGPEIIGRESGFTVAGHKKKCKAAEKRVVAAGDEKNSPQGSGDTYATDICRHDTGDSGRVGGTTAEFLTFVQERRVMRKGGDSRCPG